MNNRINRLNPKTTDFDSVGGGSVVRGVTNPAAEVCIALSYSQMSAISHELIRFKDLNQGTNERLYALAAVLAEKYRSGFDDRAFKVNMIPCAVVALIEFCRVPATYKPSIRKRALLAGMTKSYFHNGDYNRYVDCVLQDIKEAYSEGVFALSSQLYAKKSMSN